MRLSGRSFSSISCFQALQSAISFCLIAALASVLSSAPARAQLAPYVLPYTLTTFAGGNPAYTIGAPCLTAAGLPASVALTAAGDGCFAPFVYVGTDPHDIRIDGAGNIYYIDNSGTGSVIHKFNPYTLQDTIYGGGATVCTTFLTGVPTSTKEGDGCSTPASDGIANTTAKASAFNKDGRGIGISPNNDLFFAGYNDYYAHRIAYATDLLSIVGGDGVATNPATVVPNPGTGTPILTSTVDQVRGISADQYGNVFLADTANNSIRETYMGNGGSVPGVSAPVAGTVYTLTAINNPGAANPTPANNVAVGTATVYKPEDVQVDTFGNVYISDTSDSMIRAIYMGTGTLIGVPTASLVAGHIYNIAGFGTGTNTNAYPGGNPLSSTIGATEPAMQVSLGTIRKFSIDRLNNLYLSDSGNNVVWFVDAATATIRVIAGQYGLTAGTAPKGCTAQTDTLGDGCPALDGDFYPNSNTGLGVAANSFGDIFVTDPQNQVAGAERLRKVTSGLNFPTTATGSTVTQNILIHFAALDTQAAATPFAVNSTDYTVGTPNCALNLDTTTDCIVPVTFKPSIAGYDPAVLTATSTLGKIGTFVVTGTGTAPTIAFDPGNTNLLTTTAAATAVKNSQGIALDNLGNAYIADTGNNRVLYYNATTNTATVFAGAGTPCGGATDAFGDGCAATAATLNAPRAVALDTTGSVYIADTGNNIVRKVSPAGIITLYAGKGTACTQASDTRGDGCPALQSTFNAPAGLAADTFGNLFVADSGNNVIREIEANTNVITIAGGGTACTNTNTDSVGDGCSATSTTFINPTGLAYDAVNKALIIADTGDNIVRKIAFGNSYTVTGTSTVSNILINPSILVAGNGVSGSSLDTNNSATKSELASPTGVAVSNGTIYIADTGNNSIRLVTTGGVITTIAGITGSTAATGTIGGGASATSTQFSAPAAVAVNASGTLYIADSGNNRIVNDVRSQITYLFGRTNETFASPLANITELNIGTAAATTPAFVETPVNSQFTLVAAANSNNSIPACTLSTSGSLAIGGICNLQAQFTPTTTGTEQSAFAQTTSNSVAGTPTINLNGIGAILTTTTSVVTQTSPTPPANSQYNGTLTLTTTVTPASCNTAAPACSPTGTVTFVVDGVALAPVAITATGSSTTAPVPATASQTISGLSVTTHTITCNYSGDSFYAASSCAPTPIVVVAATTTSTLTATNNNQPQFNNCSVVTITTNGSAQQYLQCGNTILTATVVSNTSGTPTGTVTFLVNGQPLTNTIDGSAPAAFPPSSLSGGVATLQLRELVNNSSYLEYSNSALAPGTYTLSCTYNPSTANFATSTCAPVTFTVTAPAPSLSLLDRGCSLNILSVQSTQTPTFASSCNGAEVFANGTAAGPGITPIVSTADGSTTDATIFVVPTDSVNGTFTFSCSGLPATTTCTFSPTSITFTSGTSYANPIPFDVTFWTDIHSSSLQSPSIGKTAHKTDYAVMLGWPLTFIGLFALIGLRRKPNALRGITLFGVCLLMAGSSLLLTSCAGPGAQIPALTTAGTYPITVTVSGNGVSASTIIDFKVSSPGIPGQE